MSWHSKHVYKSAMESFVGPFGGIRRLVDIPKQDICNTVTMKPTTRIMRLLSTLTLPAVASAALDCHPEGPLVPRPILPSLDSSQLLSDAADNLSSILDNAVAGSVNAGWDMSNVSFSLALVSKDQEHPGVPLWEYHHLSEGNTEGTKELCRDTQYLVGSVSKLVSDYVLLQTGVDIDMPVPTYIPELGKPGSKIEWDGITLRMLGSHLAGVPANCQDPLSQDT